MESARAIEPNRKILIADDDRLICAAISRLLERSGFATVAANDGMAALTFVHREQPDAVILDYWIGDMDGVELLRRIRQTEPELPVIVITAFPGVREAVRVMKLGACEYLTKPFDHGELLRLLANVLTNQPRRTSPAATEAGSTLWHTMGSSSRIAELIGEVSRVARTNFSVLILGETGAGKELVAREVHRLSDCSAGPFVAVDCGAIPESLFENELFGHEKGAFTGASDRGLGKLEAANHGTLFLDEVSNMPLGAQAKLLRVLQERTIYRVGSAKPLPIEVRILAATNVDLDSQVKKQLFRRDLLYRLKEFSVTVPPLRERREDIPHLAKRFLDLAKAELGKSVRGFSPAGSEMLSNYDWPGNVRELLHTVRRAVLLARDTITEREIAVRCATPASSNGEAHGTSWNGLPMKEIVRRHLISVEREVLSDALRITAGNKAAAARLLKIDYKTIHQKVKEYQIPLKTGGR